MSTVATHIPVLPKDKVRADMASLLGRDDVIAVSEGDGVVVGYTQDGQPIDENGQKANTDRSFGQRVKDWFLPDAKNVTEDYVPYRTWRAGANVSNGVVGFIATKALVVGLAAASGMSLGIIGGLLGAGTLAYIGKSLLNPVGTLAGGSAAKKVDDDPAAFGARAMNLNTFSNAFQSLLLAVPAAYFLLAPTANAGEAYATSLQTSSDQVILNHQALRGTGAIAGKNTKQDLVSGGIGLLLGVGVTAALGTIAPWAPLLAIPAMLGLNVLANRRAARALKFDNLTNGVVRSLVHQQLSGENETIQSPDELKQHGRKLPKHQLGLKMGTDLSELAQDSERLKQIADRFPGDYMMDVAKKDINIVLKEGATEEDLVQAAYQGQILSEIMASAGYKKLEAEVGAKAASLQAIDLSSGAVSGFAQTLKAIQGAGWDFGRTHIVAGGERAQWKSDSATAPVVPSVTLDQVKHFMETGG